MPITGSRRETGASCVDCTLNKESREAFVDRKRHSNARCGSNHHHSRRIEALIAMFTLPTEYRLWAAQTATSQECRPSAEYKLQDGDSMVRINLLITPVASNQPTSILGHPLLLKIRVETESRQEGTYEGGCYIYLLGLQFC
jgi:hypothetical protein